jgi:cobaltochelatase CobN
MLYGALDNDDFFMYMGGLASAVRNLDGRSPELVVTNTRDPKNPTMSTIDEFIGRELRSRYVNPTWIEGMQKEGYAGAGAMREFVEYLWGWDATVPETIDDSMWQETFDVYVKDKHNLDLKRFFDEKSPFAYQDLTARMIETVRKGYWNPDADTLKTLLTEYVDSVRTHGVGCSEHTCGNPRFLEYVAEQAVESGVPVPAVQELVAALQQAIGGQIPELAAAAREFVAANEARLANRQVPGPEAAATEQNVDEAELQGYLMQNVNGESPTAEERSEPQSDASRDLRALWVGLVVLAVLLAWRMRRRGVQ